MAFDLKRTAEVIRTNATVPNQGDFLATHTPFRNLSCVLSGLTQQSAKKIDEETFLQQWIFAKRGEHQFLVIQGDNGSGKSHFIRWIKERYISQVDPENEAVLLIVRDQNTLRGALEQIINSNIFPSGMKLNDIKKLVEANQHLNKEALKQSIAVQFAVAAQNAPVEDTVLDKKYIKKVYPFLTDQTVQEYLSKPNGPIDRIYRRLNADGTDRRQDDIEPRFLPNDLLMDRKLLDQLQRLESNRNAIRLAEDLFDSSKGPEVREKLARFLNQHLEFVVQSCTNLRSADLKNVFEELRITLKQVGKNLTLFIEDITSFTGIDRALVEVLVTENAGSSHNEKFCRLFSVVGVTNDYYQTSFPDNLKERVTGRVFIDQATLNGPEELAEMAGRYINAICLPAEQLESWVKEGAREEALPISRVHFNHRWAIYQLADGRELSIFPFNMNALNNMYKHLPVKTPRRFLQDVVSHMIRTYSTYGLGDFPPTVSDFEGEFKVPSLNNPLHEQAAQRKAGQHAERLVTLLRVWGDGTALSRDVDGVKTLGGMPKEIFDSFKLPFVEGVREGGTSIGSGLKPESIQNPQANPVPLEPIPPPSTLQPVVNKGQEEFKKINEELDNWLRKDGKLKSFRELREDIQRLLLDYIDWDAEGIPAPVVSAFLTTQRVSIEGQIGMSFEGFKISRSEEAKSALLALAAWRHLGKKSWNFDDSVGYLANLYNWLSTVKDQVVATLRCPAGQDPLNWDLSRWGVLVHYYVCAFSGKNLGGSDVDTVYHSIFQPSIKVEQQENRSDEWSSLQNRLVQNNKTITNSHELLKKYYNKVQGSITGTTDVYFIDALPLLRVIEDVQQSNWDLTSVNIRLGDKSDLLWYWSLKIIDVLQGKAGLAQKSEVDRCVTILQELEKYTGANATDKEINNLYHEMIDFLSKVLIEANEAFSDQEFKPLIAHTLTANQLKQGRRALQGAVQTVGTKQLLILAAHPLQKVVPHLKLLKDMDKLLDAKIEKFELRQNNLALQGSQAVRDIIQKASSHLVNLRDAYGKIN